jgi:plastocyanin
MLLGGWFSARVASRETKPRGAEQDVDQSEEVVSQGSQQQGFSWKSLLHWSAIVGVVVIAAIHVFGGVIIPPLIIFAVVWIVGLIWLRRSTMGPAILLLVSLVAFIGLSAPFVLPTLTVPASAGDFILNLASLLAAIAGIVAAVALIRGRLEASGAARQIGLGGIALFVVGAVFSIVATVAYEDATAEEGDVQLVAKDIEFSVTSLTAEAGEVSVIVDNQDPTFHTFTIDELDVDLDIPASKTARVTFQAEPGVYEFYCVPHESDMEGTIEIR